MRRSLCLALLALPLSATFAAAGEDDLFSSVAVESVFAGSAARSAGEPTAASADAAVRVTSAAQLAELCRSIGMKPERVDAKTVATTLAHGEWKIPLTLRAAVDRDRVDLVLGLATRKDADAWKSDKLLELIAAPDTGGAYFALDRTKNQLQLRQSLPARALSGAELARELTEMAELAVSRESAWYTEEKKAETTAKTPDSRPATLDGSWVADLGSGEAFAIRLAAGRFALAHVKAGRTTTSKGKAEQAGDRLSLVGDSGVTIRGTVSGATSAGFELALASGRKLSFKKAGK
ncbi:type III secretion system chaperone [Botrimarina sp.]|uniref:type III secretion system chaperone n=1 Tax=Botrimarina sp. TaxID=2795802 RepID=UPI0032EC2DC2